MRLVRVLRVLVQREDEVGMESAEGEFRPAGGDFQGMAIYRPIRVGRR